MRNLVICFTLFALCFAVLATAPFTVGENVKDAATIVTIAPRLEVQVALGPFPFPPRPDKKKGLTGDVDTLDLGPFPYPPRPGGVCCEMRRETRKCVRWCDPGLVPNNRSTMALGLFPFSDRPLCPQKNTYGASGFRPVQTASRLNL
jgi:hypothetical protein